MDKWRTEKNYGTVRMVRFGTELEGWRNLGKTASKKAPREAEAQEMQEPPRCPATMVFGGFLHITEPGAFSGEFYKS